jgi:phosphoglycolate phosphatase
MDKGFPGSRWRLIVFDWDGTLMDSTQAIVRSAQFAIGEIGMPARTDRQIREIIGLGLQESWQALYPDDGRSDFEAFASAYRRHFLATDQQLSQPYPGVRDMLCRLQGMGFLLAVATGKSRHGLDLDLRRTGFESLFDVSRTCDESRSKPHPLMLHQIMECLGMDASLTLMVGDTDYDLRMAREADVAAVGVVWGAHRRQRLERQNPEACLEDLCELPGWLIR